MKIRRLKTLNVFGKTYRIQWIKDKTKVDIKGNDILWGQVVFGSAVIRINKNLTEDQIFQTLLHEMVHAVIAQGHVKDLGNDDHIDILATGIADCLTRNGLASLK